MKKYLLFDLDGTVTDSMLGITNAAAYALEAFGIREEREQLLRFVGPPLRASFMEFYGFTEAQAESAVEKYREYYEEKGIFENEVYAGMADLLKSCKEAGYAVILATAKPQNYAEQILEYFGLRRWFDDVQGCSMDKSKDSKTAVIRCALEENGVERLEDAVMIGDRKHDIEGAKACGIASIGVLFGYGTREELENSGADWIVESVEALKSMLL